MLSKANCTGRLEREREAWVLTKGKKKKNEDEQQNWCRIVWVFYDETMSLTVGFVGQHEMGDKEHGDWRPPMTLKSIIGNE